MERYKKIFAPMHKPVRVSSIPKEEEIEVFQDHITKMKEDAEWGTTTELMALCTMLSVNIAVFICDKWTYYRPFFNYENLPSPKSN